MNLTATKVRLQHLFAKSLGWLTRRSGLPRILTFHSVQTGGDPLVHQPPELFEELIRYLAEQGCRRIGWLGPPDKTAHTMDRLSGAPSSRTSE